MFLHVLPKPWQIYQSSQLYWQNYPGFQGWLASNDTLTITIHHQRRKTLIRTWLIIPVDPEKVLMTAPRVTESGRLWYVTRPWCVLIPYTWTPTTLDRIHHNTHLTCTGPNISLSKRDTQCSYDRRGSLLACPATPPHTGQVHVFKVSCSYIFKISLCHIIEGDLYKVRTEVSVSVGCHWCFFLLFLLLLFCFLF